MCLKCHEEIFHIIPKGREFEILLEVKRWLVEKLGRTAAEDLVEEALLHIRDLKDIDERQTSPVCRYCLLEFIYESLLDINSALADQFKITFLKIYAFDEVGRNE